MLLIGFLPVVCSAWILINAELPVWGWHHLGPYISIINYKNAPQTQVNTANTVMIRRQKKATLNII